MAELSVLSVALIPNLFTSKHIHSCEQTQLLTISRLDVPAFDWPIATYPKYKYPLEENLEDNQEVDRKCLAEIHTLIDEYGKKGIPVAGLIIEPIQGEGGDNHGSEHFFRGLRKLTKDSGVAFIVDEVIICIHSYIDI